MATSPPDRRAKIIRRRSSRAGFTLMEMLIVLALIALASALAFGAAGRSLDGSITHTEVYSFQRQLLDLREEAYREDRVFELRDPGDEEAAAAQQQLADRAAGNLTDVDGDGVEDDLPSPFPTVIPLRDRYGYTLSEPITVMPNGTCTSVVITILRDEKPASIIQGLNEDDGCHLMRTG